MPLPVLVGRIQESDHVAQARPLTRIIGGKVEAAFINRNIDLHFSFLENQLATIPNGGEFMCGTELSCVDILLVYPLEAAKGRAGITKERYPHIVAYVDRLTQRPAYKKAIQKIIDETGSYSNDL